MADVSRSLSDLGRERDQRVAMLKRREEERIVQALSAKLGIPYRNLHTSPINGAALTLRPLKEQQDAQAVIIERDERELTVGTPDPESAAFTTLQQLLQKEGFRIKPVIISHSSLKYGWSVFPQFAYLQTRTTGEVAINQETLERFQEEIFDIKNLTTQFQRIARSNMSIFVELLLAGSLRLDASDIHVEPQETGGAKIRYRLDGLLHDVTTIQQKTYHFLLERIKLLSNLKLNVTHRGQDGRFSIGVRGKTVDVRVSTLPGSRGEFIVMRLLNPQSLLDVVQLGLRSDLLSVIDKELERPNGMILTTGPTGSGKTTMLYSFLRKVTKPELKVITIEDPIEYRIEGIEQTQVDPSANYTFASGLRSIVRQDPDIVLVGEIRDQETASIALNAALTGHLVFSTLHTNDAAGAIPRLMEMGINPAVMGPAINVVMAQRLVRRVCERCSTSGHLPDSLQKNVEEALATLPPALKIKDLPTATVRTARGCPVCHLSGYRGRIGIFEMFLVNEAMERFTLQKPAVVQIRDFAIKQGMVTLQQDALLRVFEGVTTIEEILRITGPIVAPHEANVPLEIPPS